MNKINTMKHIPLIFLILLVTSCSVNRVSRTEVSIVGEEFYINGKPTFEGKTLSLIHISEPTRPY